MDTLRGNFAERPGDDLAGYDAGDEEIGREDPPADIGSDERRMQVRAYNHWASLLDNRNFPAIDDLEPGNLPDFGPYSVLLDFSAGIENPGIAYLGDKLAAECGGSGMATLADVPPRSLLSRITDHYMQILANQAPIGFEAEFVNQRGATILYRGILLPFSSDDDAIDFIYGVINWKEMADQQAADALLLEIGQALDDGAASDEGDEPADEPAPPRPTRIGDEPLTDWADGPAADLAAAAAPGSDSIAAEDDDDVLELDLADEAFEDEFGDESEDEDEEDGEDGADEAIAGDDGLPRPRFGSLLSIGHAEPRPVTVGYGDETDDEGEFEADYEGDDAPLVPIFPEAAPVETEPALESGGFGLGDWLAAAREQAEAARHGEERSRAALYEAIGRAYDFSLAAAQDPEGLAELLADSGIAAQERAPMTPVVKLVFGASYDKTRLTEYAAALAHAHRRGLGQGELAEYLREAEGGLKGVVEAERRLRTAESGKPVAEARSVRTGLARKLRKLEPQGLEALPAEGPEFALVVVRRLADGAVAVVGEVPEDIALVERAAKKLLG